MILKYTFIVNDRLTHIYLIILNSFIPNLPTDNKTRLNKVFTM